MLRHVQKCHLINYHGAIFSEILKILHYKNTTEIYQT